MFHIWCITVSEKEGCLFTFSVCFPNKSVGGHEVMFSLPTLSSYSLFQLVGLVEDYSEKLFLSSTFPLNFTSDHQQTAFLRTRRLNVLNDIWKLQYPLFRRPYAVEEVNLCTDYIFLTKYLFISPLTTFLLFPFSEVIIHEWSNH